MLTDREEKEINRRVESLRTQEIRREIIGEKKANSPSLSEGAFSTI